MRGSRPPGQPGPSGSGSTRRRRALVPANSCVRPMKSVQARQRGRTFTEAARRAQIVDAAIATIAEFGYANASLARIASCAGLSSTGLISYHFAGKVDLVQEVVTKALAVLEPLVAPDPEGDPSEARRLATFIQRYLALSHSHPGHVRALIEIAAARGEDGRPVIERPVAPMITSRLEETLRRGQARGNLRPDFDAHVMAVTVRAGVDQMLHELVTDPSLDLDSCTRELVTTFDLATRRSPSRSGRPRT